MKRVLRTVILLLVRILGAPGAFIAGWQARRWKLRGTIHAPEQAPATGTIYTPQQAPARGAKGQALRLHIFGRLQEKCVDNGLAPLRPLRSRVFTPHVRAYVGKHTATARVQAYAGKHTATARVHAPHILIVRPDHLGDMLLVTPILQAIKERVPNAHITMMVGQWSADIVERHPAIDKILTCPFPGFQRASQKPLEPYKLLFTTAKQLRRDKYDLAINLRPDFWWGGALLYLASVPQRIGYAIAPSTPFLTQALTFPPAEHATVSNLRLASTALQTLGYDALVEPYTPARYPLYFKPTQAELEIVHERLLHEGITAETPLVIIHAGTGGAVKLWRIEGWAHIANRLASTPVGTVGSRMEASSIPTRPQARIVLTGSPKERPMLGEIAQGIKQPPLLMTDLTVGQLAALLARAQLVLGVDNGPLHMAAAQDTPSIRIYGPTDAHIFGPWGDATRHIVIASTQKCADCPLIPCGRLDFSAEELVAHPCVRVITEERVEREIVGLVGKESLLANL